MIIEAIFMIVGKKSLISVSILFVFLFSLSFVSAQMEMNSGNEQATESTTMNTWQDNINQVSYPLTAIVSIFTLVVCILLIKATGMQDKFGMIAVGLVFFFIQSVLGVVYYVQEPRGILITMPTMMFILSSFSSIGLLLIGVAFYRWKKMIAA